MNIYTPKYKLFFYFSVFIFLFIYYFSLISHNPILNYDDYSLIGPINHLKGLDQYFSFLNAGILLDVQPVRDFVYFATIKLNHYIPFINFHFINFFFWFLTIVVVFNILLILSNDLFLSTFIALIISISPIATSSVAWISAQKHVLSTFFIVLLTLLSIRIEKKHLNLRNAFWFIILYNLAIYSHPINLLWPLWLIAFLIFKKFEFKKIVFFSTPLFLSAFICGTLNINYYTTIFVQTNAGIGKYDPNIQPEISSSLLALGRYVFISFFPFDSLPSPHYIGSIQNIIGLFLLVIVLYCTYLFVKKYRDYRPALFLFYFLIPLFPVVYKVTRIFCSDTYVLNAYLGFWVFILFIISKFRSFYFKLFLIFYFVICSLFNFSYVKIFNNSKDLWNYSYAKEATPDSTVALAKTLLGEKKFNEAEILIRRVHDWQPNNIEIYSLAVNNIFFNPGLTPEYKIKRLNGFIPRRPIVHFYLSILYANQKDLKKLNIELLQVFNNPNAFLIDFPNGKEKVIGTYLAICDKFLIKNGIVQLESFKTFFKGDNWNYALIKKHQIDSLKNDLIVFEL